MPAMTMTTSITPFIHGFLLCASIIDGDVILETDGAGLPLRAYTLAGSHLVSSTEGGVTRYFQQDALGSVRGLTDSTGAITDTYFAFGELLDSTGTTTNSYRYAGQQYDALSGLYSMRARYYDPGMGRFLTQDTWAIDRGNPIELNRYHADQPRPAHAGADAPGAHRGTADVLLRRRLDGLRRG
jgi:RHS repeat-associated protein